MNAQNPQYKAIYDPVTNTYRTSNGLNVLSGLDSVGNQLATQNFSNVIVKFSKNGQTYEHTFKRSEYPPANSINYERGFSDIKDIATFFSDLYIGAISTGPAAEAALGLTNFKTQLIFEGVKGTFGVTLDITNGLISGESFGKAFGSAGINIAANLVYGLEALALVEAVLLLPYVTVPLAVIAGLAGVVGSLYLSDQVNQAVKNGTGGQYDDVGDYIYDEVANSLHVYGQIAGSAMQLAGKNLSNIRMWQDQNTNKVNIKGDDFTTEIDPTTGRLTFRTGTQATRDAFGNINNLEGLINNAKQKYGDLYGNSSEVKLENTATGQTSTFNRISKPVEQMLNQQAGGQSTTLNNLLTIQQNADAKYVYKSQMPNLKLKNAEYNQAKKDNLQTGINQAKSQGTLPTLARQQTVDDRARSFVKAAGINRPDDDPRNNEFTFFRETRQYEGGDLVNGARGKTEVDVLKIDLRTGLQRLATHLDDYDPKIANEYDKAAAENARVKQIWLGYSQRVGNALGKAPAIPSGLAVDPNTIPTTPTTMGGRPGIGLFVPRGTGMEDGLIIFDTASRENTYASPPANYNGSVTGVRSDTGQPIAFPLMIDLPGSPLGFETLGAVDNAIYFDILQDGKFYRTGWAGPTDGILVVDDLNDNKITNSSEFFGSSTSSGFFELMGYDTNRNGFVDAGDINFSKIKIWQDINSNATTDAGELRTLAYYNIESLSLAHITTPMIAQDNGNVITQVSLASKFDKTTLQIGDAGFRYSATDNIKPQADTVLLPETLAMPWVRGTGSVQDLVYALQSSSGLRTTVSAMMSTTSLPALLPLIDSFLIQWAGVEASAATPWTSKLDSTNVYSAISQQQGDLLGKFLNTDLNLFGDDVDATAQWVNSSYHLVKSRVLFALLAQLPVGEGLGLTYNAGTDSFKWDLATDAEALGKLYMADNGVWRQTLTHAQSFFGTEMGLATPTVIRTGAALLTGTEGTDLLDGGLGVETLQGGAGSDAYIWRRGDGNDVIQDTGGMGDTVVFSSGVKADQVRLETPGDGSVFVRDTVSGQSIRFVDPGAFDTDGARLLQSIEKFVFTSNDNQMVKTSDLFVRNSLATSARDIITGTPMNDYIQGLAGNDWLQGFNGNDYLEGGTGTDNLDGYEGDDIYFFSPGDGSDTIREFNKGGNDTILFSSAVDPLKVALFRSVNDLVVKYTSTDKVTVKDYFPTSGASDVEKIQLADGRFLSVIEVDSLVMQVAQYRTSGGAALTTVDQVQTTPALMSVIAAAF
jgi:Ca2+-binding RTX toxin-like protein